MTVEQLRKALDGLDGKMLVVVNHETDGEMNLFELVDASPAKGEPRRDERSHKAGFKFDRMNGGQTWLFISVEEA